MSPSLRRLFQAALRVGRRVRRTTGIERLAVTYVTLAADRLAAERAPGAPDQIGIAGGGALACDLARELLRRGRGPLVLATRHPERVLARLGGACLPARQAAGTMTVISLDRLANHLPACGSVVLATSSPHPILRSGDLHDRLTPLLLMDLGVPSNFAEDGPMPAAVRLWRLVDLAPAVRPDSAVVQEAERRIQYEVERYLAADLPAVHAEVTV